MPSTLRCRPCVTLNHIGKSLSGPNLVQLESKKSSSDPESRGGTPTNIGTINRRIMGGPIGELFRSVDGYQNANTWYSPLSLAALIGLSTLQIPILFWLLGSDNSTTATSCAMVCSTANTLISTLRRHPSALG
jgi:hypothetical protein